MALLSYIAPFAVALGLYYLLQGPSSGIEVSNIMPFGMLRVSAHTPASKQFNAWLKLFNIGDRDALLGYHMANFPYDVASEDVADIEREMVLSTHTGGFNVMQIQQVPEERIGEDEEAVSVLLREKKRPQFARASMKVDLSKKYFPVAKFEIHPIPTPVRYALADKQEKYGKALAPLTAQRRHMVLDEIADVVRKRYIFPDIGDKMIKDLQERDASGEYDHYAESDSWARRMTEDMLAVSNDQHIRVMFAEPPTEIHDGDGDNLREPPDLFDRLKDMNFGLGQPYVEAIDDHRIGFLPINGFVPSTSEVTREYEKIQRAIGDIISQVADTDALVLDLRRNGGGHPSTVAFMLSYFLADGPVHLHDFLDRDGVVKSTYSTLPTSELPKDTHPFGGSKPLFVLTSKRTISGGEDMSYNLQARNRATAIIGDDETTAGAANLVTGPSIICEEEFGGRWWHVGIPDTRPVNVITGTNWEGFGVRSDIVVGKSQDPKALARSMALEELALRDDAEPTMLVQ
ncbi:hypothetical protein LTR20_002808 [Exophiala xenobiotica]|nr:hypothetical protein LTS13_000550 [Exophiala xenobiotica]KAK5403687.1 hypothetical protein LTR79_000441 [Exophiala xenobiotica]KAK5423176.1 hypothetical protein LTR90_002195 [Exophiala xenobiotica]KAK5468463.1 hypothetical protein LTR20_002808 [Exophiala xenobiotica]KAK5495701.1 hypothetical protein LTR26_002318 [Exophiala xenobiotica]